jgi:peptidoglycan/LPS O-acetylase OafA/YrhL
MRRNIPPLTSLRFIAAMWVFLFHVSALVGPTGFKPIDNILKCGADGMTFFFVLSGFILARASHGTDVMADYRGYFGRRVARIYPAYLFILVIGWYAVGFAAELGPRPFRSGAAHAVADLTLTNAWFPQMFGGTRGGTWSLSVEAFFYAIFPLLLHLVLKLNSSELRRGIVWAIGATLFFSLMGRYIQPMEPGLYFATFYAMPIFRFPEFLAGVMAGVLSLRGDVEAPQGRKVILVSCLAILLLAFGAKALPEVALGALATPALLAVFRYFAHHERGPAVWLFSRPTFVFLGEASFALYLVQIVTIPLYLAKVEAPGGWSLALFVVCTIAIACLVHLFVERPMRPLVTRWLSPKPVA